MTEIIKLELWSLCISALCHKTILALLSLTNKLAPNEFSKVAGYKIDILKSVAFIYPNKKLSERAIQKAIPLKIASESIKYLGKNLTKEVKTYILKTVRH